MVPGPGLGPFWVYFKPKLVHLGNLVLGLGHFEGSWAWIWACFKHKSAHSGDLGGDLEIPGPGLGPLGFAFGLI